jgi:hypothetical protein
MKRALVRRQAVPVTATVLDDVAGGRIVKA